jgi:hypothetical protein
MQDEFKVSFVFRARMYRNNKAIRFQGGHDDLLKALFGKFHKSLNPPDFV